jgi:hypothetical protein
MNDEIISDCGKNFICHCGAHMMKIMDTFLCPCCEQSQIEDLNWCKQHIEMRIKEGKKP